MPEGEGEGEGGGGEEREGGRERGREGEREREGGGCIKHRTEYIIREVLITSTNYAYFKIKIKINNKN